MTMMPRAAPTAGKPKPPPAPPAARGAALVQACAKCGKSRFVYTNAGICQECLFTEVDELKTAIADLKTRIREASMLAGYASFDDRYVNDATFHACVHHLMHANEPGDVMKILAVIGGDA